MAKSSDIIKIGFDYRASLEQFVKETNGVFDGISEKAGKQRISIQLDAKNDKVIEKIKELQKLKLDSFTFEFGESGLAEQLKTFDQLEKKITEIINLSKGINNIGSGNGIGNSIVDEKSLNSIIDLFGKMESHLGEMKKVFADVGDGEEFSPLLKMINDVQASIKELSTSVSKIKLDVNMDLGSGVNEERLNQKVSQSMNRQLEAYRNLFTAMKSTGKTNKEMLRFFEPDDASISEIIGAYKGMIKRAEEQFGKDIYKNKIGKDTYSAYIKEIKNATDQFNRATNKKNTENPLGDLFGKNELIEVVSQLGLIADRLSEISSTVSGLGDTFKSVFKEGFNVSASVEEIEKLTSRVKELEDELSKVKISSTTPIKDTFQGDAKSSAESSAPVIKEEAKAMEQVAENAEKASKGKEKFAKANKNVKASADASTGSIEKENSALDEKVWEKNLKVIQEYMDANTKLNKLNAKDKGTGKHASDIARQEKEVEKLRESAIEARAALSSMVNPHEAPIDDWGKWVEAMEKFEQATKGSAESVAKLEDALRSARNAQLSSIDSTINNGQSKYEDFNARKAQSDAYKNSLKELGETLERLRTLRASLSNTRAFTDEEQAQIDDLTQSVRDHVKEIQRMSAGEKGSDALSRDKWANRIREYMDKNTRLTREFREELENLIRILRTGGDSVVLKDVIGQFEDAKFRIKEAKLEGKSFFDIFKDKAIYGFAARLAQYYLSFYDFIRYARYAINALIELDSALLDLKKTTSMTENQLEDFYYASNDVAKQMGVTTAEIIEQASAWSRLGYSSQEAATKMAQLSSQFASISPGMETDQAQEGLVSIMKAWDISYNEVKSEIMDNINILGKQKLPKHTVMYGV